MRVCDNCRESDETVELTMVRIVAGLPNQQIAFDLSHGVGEVAEPTDAKVREYCGSCESALMKQDWSWLAQHMHVPGSGPKVAKPVRKRTSKPKVTDVVRAEAEETPEAEPEWDGEQTLDEYSGFQIP